MSVPAVDSATAYAVPRLDSAGKLSNSFGGANSGLATLDSGGKVPSTQAPDKAVYSTGGAQALTPSDIGAIDASTVLLLDGSHAMTGDLSMNSHKVTGVTAGTSDTDAANFAQSRMGALKPIGLKTSNFTAVWGETYMVNATSGAVTITMPACGGSGKLLEIIRVDSVVANAVTVQRAGSDNINGGTSISVPAQFEAAGIRDAGSTSAIRVY